MDGSASGYLQAWDVIGKLLAGGRSWSGRERNGCFLNTGDGRFVGVAGLTGLDYADDSRAVAVVDWDGDGDLDLWMSNRTAPRVRFLRNEVSSENRFVALKLQGVVCNRDAIGARVSLLCEGEKAGAAWRTLRAGEGYLAQSSKWIHFGLPDGKVPIAAVVRWPGGEMERFVGVGVNGRYRLVQGVGRAERLEGRKGVVADGGFVSDWESSDAARIVPHDRLPLPPLRFVGLDGVEAVAAAKERGNLLLVTLWATWCAPCLAEMKGLEARRGDLERLGIETLPLNVENFEDSVDLRLERVRRFCQRNRLTAHGGLATEEVVEVFDALQRSVVARQKPLPVPCSFLLDSEGRVAVIYKGKFAVERLLEDAREIVSPTMTRRDFAVPFGGRWYVNALPTDVLALPKLLLKISRAETALSYLQLYDEASATGEGMGTGGDSFGVSRSDLYWQVGSQLFQGGQSARAVEAFEGALGLDPSSVKFRAALALALEREGKLVEAVGHYREIVRRQPNQAAALNSLAWILGTTADAAIRDPAAAVGYAERACAVTDFEMPETLDTLAAAYAAQGRFDEAVETADSAIALAESAGRNDLASVMRQRRDLYGRGEAYRLP